MDRRTLIGYLAQTSPYEFVCDGDALVVVGSKAKLKTHLARQETMSVGRYELKQAWFEDILAGMRLGGAYAFDEKAYNRFYPLGQRAGLTLGPEDFSIPPPAGVPPTALHLVRVQWYGLVTSR